MYLTRLSQEKRRLAIQAQPPQSASQFSQQQQLQQHQQQTGQRPPNGSFPLMQNAAMMMQSRQQNLDAPAQQQQTAHNLAPQQSMQPHFSGTQPGQVASHLNMRSTAFTQFAFTPVDELRKLGIPDNSITLIEQNRPILQRQFHQHQALQAMQRGQAPMQQNQTSQGNFSPNVRPNIPGSAGGSGEASHMPPVNIMQQSPQIQSHGQNNISSPAQNAIPSVYTRPTAAQLHSATEFIHQVVLDQTVKLSSYSYSYWSLFFSV